MTSTSRLLLLTALLSPASPVAWAQSPAGSEFQVNSYTTGWQYLPSVASDANGNFVVVWTSSGQDGSGSGIFGQRLNAAGVPEGSEFQVNTYTTGSQQRAKVASDATGNFVVAWQGPGWGVFGRRFSASGVPQGGQFQVSSGLYPSVASGASGDFVVVWETWYQLGPGWRVFGQRYDGSGVAQGGEFQVSSYTSAFQMTPSVASDANGSFVVVWRGDDGSGRNVFGRRYDASGVAQGDEFRINSSTSGSPASPSVASDANGNFVVVWTSPDGSYTGILGRRFNTSGVPQGSEFQVNSYTTGIQQNSAVASNADGSFVVVWEDTSGGMGHGFGVFGQRYDASGLPQGDEFLVYSSTVSWNAPAVSLDANGNFMVVWQSLGPDGDGIGIFGQRYGDRIFMDGFE